MTQLLIRGVRLSSDWLIALTYQRPQGHQTAHPADLALGQVESILKTATLLRISKPRRVSFHLVWRQLEEGGGWAGPANAGAHHQVAQGGRKGGKILGAIPGYIH